MPSTRAVVRVDPLSITTVCGCGCMKEIFHSTATTEWGSTGRWTMLHWHHITTECSRKWASAGTVFKSDGGLRVHPTLCPPYRSLRNRVFLQRDSRKRAVIPHHCRWRSTVNPIKDGRAANTTVGATLDARLVRWATHSSSGYPARSQPVLNWSITRELRA